MKLSHGAWLPDDEQDQVMLGAGSDYQAEKFKHALAWVDKRRVAVDIGAHCGLWSMQMARKFDRVIAFEPLDRHIECFKKNVEGIELHQLCLGDRRGSCDIKVVETLSGRSHVNGEDGDYLMAKLDNMELETVDFIKVDAEGYELFILKGAEKTLLRCRPCVIVEQKQGMAGKYGIADGEAIAYLESLGAKQRDEIHGDFVMSWDKTQ